MTAVFRKTTPEEKLLHIIEGSKDINISFPQKTIEKKDNPSHPRLTNPLAFLSKADFNKITLRNINKILIGISVIFTISLIFYLAKTGKHMRIKFDNLKKQQIEKESLPLSITQKNIPDLSSYLADTSKNNPFKVLPFVEEAGPEKAEAPTDFKLVGILWSDKAQAIIEESQSQKTHLVYEGDLIEKYTVTEITQTEVKLSSQDGDKILQ